jgi:NAD(P)H-hydrate epimerase
VSDGDDLLPLLAACDLLAIGPGLGQDAWAHSLLAAAIVTGKPMLTDADGLNLLAENPRSMTDAVLTPHPGEAARLLGCDTATVQRDRFAALDALVERFRCVVVLKGAGTLVGAPGETTRIIAAGNPGMAVGGMGDVLAGVVAALRAQGLPAFEAGWTGALLHAAAGDAAAREGGERGLLASDLFPLLRRLVNER